MRSGSFQRLLVEVRSIAGCVLACLAVLVAIAPAAAQQPPPAARTAMTADGVVLPSTIAPPADVAAAKAFSVLSVHCARCHQAGSLKSAAASGHFANVLDLEALAAEPALVRPGLPDLSRLYTVMLQRHFPVDAYADSAGGEPSHLEIEAVRAWIDDLGPRRKACANPPLTDAQVSAAMAGWLDQVGAAVARTTRFVSLVPLYNACTSEPAMAGYRQAVQKLFASLSWSPEPARVETVGDSLAILAVRLDQLGWVDAHWDRLAKGAPRGSMPALAEAVRSATGSSAPVLRGDWMANAALEPPLYYELLGLPPTQAELFNMAAGDKSGLKSKSMRAAIRQSAVTRANRVLERWRGERGFIWQAYDFATTGDGHDAFERPLGPKAAGGAPSFKPSGSRVMFALPNGFPAFALHDADGRIATRVAPGIDRDAAPAAAGASAGRACMACHANGPVSVQDEMRAHAASDKFTARDLRDQVLADYATAADLGTAFDDDKYAVRRALVRSGIDPDLSIDGLEPVAALARRYRLDVTADRIAGELGLPLADLTARLEKLQGAVRPLGLRLAQGTVSRSEAEIVKLSLAESTAKSPPVETAAVAPVATSPAARNLRLALWSEKSVYKAGELAAVYAQPSADCNLTLISIDPAGKATVLFPNDFEQDNAVAAGRVVRMPAADAPYQLRLKEKGRETIVGICQAGPRVPAAIEHDYERQRFTLLGNWKNFINVSLLEAAEQRRNPERAERAQAQPRRGRRGETARSEPRSSRLEAEARAAIAITVE